MRQFSSSAQEEKTLEVDLLPLRLRSLRSTSDESLKERLLCGDIADRLRYFADACAENSISLTILGSSALGVVNVEVAPEKIQQMIGLRRQMLRYRAFSLLTPHGEINVWEKFANSGFIAAGAQDQWPGFLQRAAKTYA